MASKRIAGITIEIGGDTTKLSKALEGVDKDLRSTQASLRDVTKLLKLDPGNVELLTQKQGYLAKAIEDTKKKLEIERDAMKQLADANGAEEPTEEQKALAREIVETEKKLESLEKEYKNFGSVASQQIQQAGEKMKAVGEGMKKTGEGMTKAITGPIVAIGAGSVAAWKEVDEALDTVTVKTGASGEALADMQTRVKNIAGEIPVSFQTAADAVGEVNTRFGLTGDALEELSTQFAKFAELNGTDVTSSVDSVQAAMAAFNIDASEAGTVLDVLTKAGQDTGVSVLALSDDLTKNAVALQEMGFGLEESVGFMANLNKNGLDSNAVMAGMKKALQNATKEGKSLDQAMDELQGSIAGASSDTEAAQIAMELFGDKAGTTIADGIRTGKLSFDDMTNAVKDFGGSVSSTYEETQDPLDSLTTTMNDLKTIGADIVEASGPMLEEVLGGIRDTVKDLSEKWASLDTDQQQAIITFAAVAAAIGPILVGVGSLITAVGTITSTVGAVFGAITAAGGLVPALTALGTAAAPFLIGGAIIAGVIAAVVLITTHWEEIKAAAAALAQWVGEKWEAIKTKISETVEAVKEKVEDMKQKVQEKWEALKQKVSDTVEGLKTSVQEKFEAVKTKATEIFESIKSKISEKIEAAKETVRGAIEAIKGFFNFEWHLPHIALPHFSLVGEFSLMPPSVPRLSVDWYKKAYDTPIMFTSPTVIQTPAGLKGFGDGAGGEIVLSESRLRSLTGRGGSSTYNVTFNISAQGGDARELAQELAPRIQDIFVSWQAEKEAAGVA